MQRRSFLASMLALGAAPAVVKATSLMKVRPSGILVPEHEFVFSWPEDSGPTILTELKYETHTEWYLGDKCVIEASGQKTFNVSRELIQKYRGHGEQLSARVSLIGNGWKPQSLVVKES